MPDDSFRQAKTLTAAIVAAAAIVATLCFTPILDAHFCFPHICAPAPGAQDDCPDKGAGCEPACAGGQDSEEGKVTESKDGGGSVTTTIDDHSVTIGNINIYGSVGRTARKGEDWCPLPPSGKTAVPDESSSDGTPSNGKSPSVEAATSDEGKEDEEGECAAGSSGKKEPLGEVYFKNDSADFRDLDGPWEKNEETLNCVIKRIEDRLREQPGDVIVLEAYASHLGSAVYNLNLAEERIKSVARHIGGKIHRATWTFRQVIRGESHIYRTTGDTGDTSDQKGDPKNRVVRILACSGPCCDMEQEAVSNP